MSTVTGNGLKLRLQLAQLAVRHGVHSNPVKIPLSEPSEFPQHLAGFASTISLDRERVRFAPFCFGMLRQRERSVPLLYKHLPDQVAGSISVLEYNDEGNLVAYVVADHPMAKRCGAFSVGAVINSFEILKADTPKFFARVTSATLTEISLTDTPSNPDALVHEKYRVSPEVKFLELMTAKVKLLQKLTAMIQKEINHADV